MVFRHLTHPAACRCDGASQRRLEGRAFTVNGCPLVTSKNLSKPENSLKTNTRLEGGSLFCARRFLHHAHHARNTVDVYISRHGCHGHICQHTRVVLRRHRAHDSTRAAKLGRLNGRFSTSISLLRSNEQTRVRHRRHRQAQRTIALGSDALTTAC